VVAEVEVEIHQEVVEQVDIVHQDMAQLLYKEQYKN